jgi:quinol monooxygenase YgiN
MIHFTARVTTSERDRPLVLDTLCQLLEPTRVLPGCVCCDLFQDAQDPNRIALFERWGDEESLIRHMRSRQFKFILAVVDLSVEQPDIRFDRVARVRGLDYVEQTLNNAIEPESTQ